MKISVCTSYLKLFLSLSIFFLLSSCDNGSHYAPVTEIAAMEAIPKTGIHQVKNKETLYEIAWRYGLDYRSIAAQNKMQEPYALHSGQAISVQESKTTAVLWLQNLSKNLLD